MERRSRRAVLGGAAGVAGLFAGCSGLGGDYETVTPAAVPTTERTPDEQSGDPLRVAHWLSGDGESAGYDAMVDLFEQRRPDVRVESVNAYGISRIEQGLEGRADRGTPPGIWQTETGPALLSLARASYLRDIGESVWDDIGGGYPADVRRAVRTDGTHISVPWTGRRVNTLLYNPSVLDRAGVDPDALGGPAALRTALATVEAETDAVALSWPGDVPWQVGRLLEGVLLARTGTERYREALESGFDTATVERAVGTVMDLTAFGRSDRDPGPTVESLLDGRVAMVAAGGRLVGGAASTSGLAARPDAAYGDDWAVTPFPGTAGTVQFGATAFGAPVEAPTPERSERWLRFVGSTPAQRRFSVAAGSFPLRTDADPSALPTPTADQYDAYRTAAARLPSITHRLVLAPDAYVRYLGALFRFDDEDRQDAVLETLTGVLSA